MAKLLPSSQSFKWWDQDSKPTKAPALHPTVNLSTVMCHMKVHQPMMGHIYDCDLRTALIQVSSVTSHNDEIA